MPLGLVLSVTAVYIMFVHGLEGRGMVFRAVVPVANLIWLAVDRESGDAVVP